MAGMGRAWSVCFVRLGPLRSCPASPPFLSLCSVTLGTFRARRCLGSLSAVYLAEQRNTNLRAVCSRVSRRAPLGPSGPRCVPKDR